MSENGSANSRPLINNDNRQVTPYIQRPIFPPSVALFFFNSTKSSVVVRWHYEKNEYKFYGILRPKTYKGVRSFYGHRWAFLDAENGEMLSTNKDKEDEDDELFSAKMPPNLTNEQESPQQNIKILKRLHPLGYLALKVVARRNDLATLSLPIKIKEVLKEYLEKKEAFLIELDKDIEELKRNSAET